MYAGSLVHTKRLTEASIALNFGAIGASVADSLSQDSLVAEELLADSLTTDSTTEKERTAGIDAPISFVAKDSMVYDAKLGLAYLFGNAKVDYQNMELTAAKITMNDYC